MASPAGKLERSDWRHSLAVGLAVAVVEVAGELTDWAIGRVAPAAADDDWIKVGLLVLLGMGAALARRWARDNRRR